MDLGERFWSGTRVEIKSGADGLRCGIPEITADGGMGRGTTSGSAVTSRGLWEIHLKSLLVPENLCDELFF